MQRTLDEEVVEAMVEVHAAVEATNIEEAEEGEEVKEEEGTKKSVTPEEYFLREERRRWVETCSKHSQNKERDDNIMIQ